MLIINHIQLTDVFYPTEYHFTVFESILLHFLSVCFKIHDHHSIKILINCPLRTQMYAYNLYPVISFLETIV